MAGAALLASGCGSGGSDQPDRFDGPAAMALVREQVGVGRRPAGSPQLRRLAQRLRSMLPNGRFEPFASDGPQRGLRNIAGTLPGRKPAILIGAHYDTARRPAGFVGANDGAAGTAAVIELARSLQRALPSGHREIRFVLFDGEEAPPRCAEADFQFCALRGSRAYATAHRGEVGEMVLLDYIANRGATFPREANSTASLWAELRKAASEAGTQELFPDRTQTPVLDDQIPFLEQGIPSIDLIDFSYPFSHDVGDTVDKLDPAVLDSVGETVAQLAMDQANSSLPPSGG